MSHCSFLREVFLQRRETILTCGKRLFQILLEFPEVFVLIIGGYTLLETLNLLPLTLQTNYVRNVAEAKI